MGACRPVRRRHAGAVRAVLAARARGVLCGETGIRSGGVAESGQSDTDTRSLRRVWENARACWRAPSPRHSPLLKLMDTEVLQLRERVLAARASRTPLRLRGSGS